MEAPLNSPTNLQPEIPWLSDSYRHRLQQEERDKLFQIQPDRSDGFVLCPNEHIETYAEHRILKTMNPPVNVPRRPQSAKVTRQLGHVKEQHVEWDRQAVWGKEGEGKKIADELYKELTGRDAGQENAEIAHSLWEAAKRKHANRPTSARGASSLPPRPSSAFSAHSRSKPPVRSRPSSAFSQPPRTRPSPRARPSSAVLTRRENALKREPDPDVQDRPSSPPQSAKPPPRRVDPYTVREKRILALRQAWTQDPRSGLHIGVPGEIGPPPHLMDRHARCLDHMALAPHRQPQQPPHLPERPHTSCGLMRTEEGVEGMEEGSGMLERPLSPEAVWAEPRDGMSRVQRYIDCHRPSSAPRMRKEVEGSFRRGMGVRGRSPHFCNFVHKVDLHTRLDSTYARTGSGTDGGEDGRDSLLSDGTDNDVLAQWRKSRLTNSGTEGRPGSPSSLDGRHGKDPRDANNAGAASCDEDVMSAKLIPTITIPSSPIPPGDQMMSSRESSPRKSARGGESAKLSEGSPQKSPSPRPSSASRPSPPSPPPAKEKEKPEKNKRLPISKKTKKSGGEKRRKPKSASGMEAAPPGDTSASGQPPASGDGNAQATANGLDVTAEVPDLPGVSSSGKRHGRKGRKSERRLITPSPGVGEKLQLPQELLDLDSNSKSGYDFTDLETTLTENLNNKYRPLNLLNNRMALSQQASRFELPMDMKVLEKITPQDYLKKFCIVTPRRLNLYQKIFLKHKDKSNNINKQGLEVCLKETLVQQLKDNTFIELCDLLDITDNSVIDFKLFSGCAAITERILYPCYTTEDTLEKPEYQREKIETADFGALDWKLHGIQVGEKMKRLLKTIE